MKFYTWKERCDFAAQMQSDLTARFGEDEYNVFLFGSFLREDYDPESSDIDLALYAKDFILLLDIRTFIENYLEERDIPYSIIQLNENDEYAFVALDALWKNVSVTDYFPESLLTYKIELTNRNRRLNDERAMIPNIYSPDGELLFKSPWRDEDGYLIV